MPTSISPTMSSQPSLPDDPRLADIASRLGESKWAATLMDSAWNLVWVSEEMKVLLDEEDEAEIGYGRHQVTNYLSDVWCRAITEDAQMQAFVNEFPMMMHDTPGGKDGLIKIALDALAASSLTDGLSDPREVLDEGARSLFEAMEPLEPPPIYVGEFEFLQRDLPPVKITEFQIRLRDGDGNFLGTAMLFGPSLPAHLLAFVARGDEEMYARMARLFDPGRKAAAVLFADLQASGALSRRLPSSVYFQLLRGLATAMDHVIIDHKGIVGKHAGDGVTAFFLAEDLGSSSVAAAAAISAAREIGLAVRTTAKEVGEESGLIDEDDCRVNVGVHWGGTLYMGQLVTGGRLEVTALGDETNECARIQESARDGAVLASKALIERLDEGDAGTLGIAPSSMLYRTLSQMPGASPKAVRDAGSIPVTVL